jgi:putative ABC transport system permease protein
VTGEIDEELRFHLESRVRDLMEAGLSRGEAAERAEREFGDRAAILSSCDRISRTAIRDHGRRRYWIGWQQDLRYASRSLARSPGFAVAALATLALGIGLTTAVFAVLHGIILNPLPYPASESLHRIYSVNPAKSEDRSPMSAADFYALRDGLAPEVRIGGYMNWPVSLTGVAEPERLDGALASADLFTTLGVAPIEGRTFVAAEEEPGRDVAVISARLAARLGLTGHAAGASMQLGTQPVTVVGVMPHGFEFPQATTDVWIPLALRPADRDNHESRWLHTIARIERPAAARVEDRLQAVMARLATDFPKSNAGWSARAVPLRQVVVGDSRPTLTVLSLAILCVMLVTVVNLVTLVSGRLHRRRAELAMHEALGAGLWRLSRQLGAEAVFVAAIGGGLGLLLATSLVGSFRNLAPASIPRAAEVSVSAWPIAFASGAAALILIAMTIVPLWRVEGSSVDALRAGGRGGPPRGSRFSRLLIVAQAGLAALLVVTAGLLAQAFVRLANVELGFKPDHVLTLRISLPRSRTPESQRAYFADVLERVGALPGITGAGASNDLPLGGNSMSVPIAFDGIDRPAGDPEVRAAFRVITPGYLEAVGSPVRGRSFATTDTAASSPVALVNESLARRYWPEREALGMRIRTSEDNAWRTVVGVVGNVHHDGLAIEEGPALYVPHAQKAEAWMTWMSVVVRTLDDPLAHAPSIRAAIAAVDRNQPVSNVTTLDQIVNTSLALPRLAAWVATAVSAIALLLAAFGIGAVLTRLVAARKPELGVRLALGADPKKLIWTPVIEAVWLVTAGGLIGLLAAAASGRLLSALLYDVSAYDLPTFAGTLLVLAMTAVVAAIGPARAVGRVDPITILRG